MRIYTLINKGLFTVSKTFSKYHQFHSILPVLAAFLKIILNDTSGIDTI